MTIKTENTENLNVTEDNFMDTSINDARWLLGGVATLGFFVMALGLFASTLVV